MAEKETRAGRRPPISNPGHYAKKQILCKSVIVSWSHRRRFDLARKLVEPYAGLKLLDYGCGDGTFLAEVYDLFPTMVGADVDLKQTLDCRERFAAPSKISFVLVTDLNDQRHNAAYDVVTCMEVLEHCVENDLSQTLVTLRRLVSPSGSVILSVPIEIGPGLVLKQIIRTWAGWRALGDYKYTERYNTHELWKMIFANENTAIDRPTYSNSADGRLFHGHKGFNWRTLAKQADEYFKVRQCRFSPLGWSWLGGYFSSQAWLICSPR
jgi:2-polyprenyl-3-methyl-5-hydroxy-6-metoxy-1,4-benzoquinol methylase